MNSQNVYFFSDETGANTQGRYFLVAGLASASHRILTAEQLRQAESVSGRDKKKWSATKNLAQRTRYIQEVLRMDLLFGRLFYATYWNNGCEHWACTADAIRLAVQRFAPNGRAIIKHQGFHYQARQKLGRELDALSIPYEIQAANQMKVAEVRLADALCGYLSICQNGRDELANKFEAPPDWLVDLKNEAPFRAD